MHKCIPPTWTMDPEMQTYMVEAIVRYSSHSPSFISDDVCRYWVFTNIISHTEACDFT